MTFSTYSVQRDSFGNLIVCGGLDVRYPYSIVLTGTYNECLQYKVLNAPTAKPPRHNLFTGVGVAT